MIQISEHRSIVLFDGYCHLCSRSVQTILEYDNEKKFLFCPLSSDTGQELISQFNIPSNIDSVILIQNKYYYIQSDAALIIAKELGGFFKLILIFKILPRKWRDQIYQWIAKNRFNWFGKRNSCMIPSADEKDRFL
ncbi:DCC1-like thiol-disulfide oxidoreductase family protein [uncultured Sunxiuqinia sp.]|uniref:thiol-disulfide oxidoreductase DCC family protein n=1 Tax=uncultured Sunxiuqinia sp. TaxID=1573825 RepID=UPI002AA81B58|nr:DCC1-like thiol-disulfide oxidoreductase family protein [uncultured Sunxiuqinia sp.]